MNKEETKFIAWDKKNNKLLNSKDLIGLGGDIGYSLPLTLSPFYGKFGYMICKGLFQEIDELIPMQYTGLKDKDGVEIYDKYVCWDASNEEYGEVFFERGAYYYRHDNAIELLGEVNDYLECVGTIFEKRELLNKN